MVKNSLPHGQTPKKVQSVDYIPAFFLLAALWFIPFEPELEALNSLSISFISIVLMYQSLFQRKAIIVLATLILVAVMGTSIGH